MKRLVRVVMVGVAVCMFHSVADARSIKATSASQIKKAISSAKAGDTIVIKPGVYDMGGRLSVSRNGKKGKPIKMLCAGKKGYAVLKSGRCSVKGAFWEFNGIHFQGDPGSSLATLKLSGEQGCHDILFVDCKISGSKQHGIKGSRTREKGGDNITFEHCEVYDTGKTAMDFVSGDNWTIRRCYVHDYGKAGGYSYAIFLKGGGVNGLIEGCLVNGNKRKGTIGISFGGGLTGERWLPLKSGKVAAEHAKGICRNNIIVGTHDVALHSNNASDCKFYNNMSYNCRKFQMQKSYKQNSTLINNMVGKLLKPGRNSNNAGQGQKAWFKDADKYDFSLTSAGKKAVSKKGLHLRDNPTDLFGNKRDPRNACLGPVLPGSKQSVVWVDRRK
ncbi:MAG: right-handed parallel beta-helix repeat-containing protein [Kiritimatiellae bacterium]|nr:right-handed parallel beta-helix repeat-containing protein [Kiritimatiellia bacterium]